MLRSLGIPARLVVGYARGQRQSSGEAGPPPEAGIENVEIAPGRYIVRERDAHAWPEVYFPGVGWVEFEPTASRQVIQIPSGDLSSLALDNLNRPDPQRDRPLLDDPTPEPFDFSNFQPRLSLWGTIVSWFSRLWKFGLLAIILAMVVFHGTILVKLEAFLINRGSNPPDWLRRWVERIRNRPPWITRLEAWLREHGISSPEFLRRWAHWASLSPIERAYSEVNRALERLGSPASIESTPTERLSMLVELVPEATEPARRLLNEYQAAIYSQHTSHPGIARWAAERIRKLSVLAWLRRSNRHKSEPTTEQAASA